MRNFIAELRHRNVFRVGIAYIIAGWLIAQVADLAAGTFKAPEWFMQMFVVLLLLGLPIALFLAWAYELTPDGVRRAKELPVDAPKDPRSGKRLNRIILIALVVAVAWLGWDKLQNTPSDDVDASAIDKSIAVLPFEDFSPDGDQAWFADGLTEEILNSLARTADLHVASRTSSFAYRDTTEKLSDIAAALEVAHILEGSVRRAGDQLRVTAQLIRAADDKHLWSETFDGAVNNSIGIQEEIATQIANALQTAMDPEELQKMVSAGTSSVEAWEFYLQALALKSESYDRVDTSLLLEAANLFDKAVAADPGFADAHRELAQIWFLQLDNTTTAYIDGGLPYEERRAHFDAAMDAWIRLARSDTERLWAQHRKATFEVRINEQLRLAEQLREIDPTNTFLWRELAELYTQTGQLGKAREVLTSAWALPRESGDNRSGLIYQMRRIDIEEALRMIDERLAASRAGSVELPAMFYYQAHRALLDAGQTERAAGIIDNYLLRSADPSGKLLVQIRQACAEGRVADADALYAELGNDNEDSRWLILKTLGHHDEARELLRQYDTPEKLFILAAHLDYRTFDPRDYPLLWKTLQSQGINRPLARPQTFECTR